MRLEGGKEVLLHLEFQGRSSREPMHLRMLAYRARLALKDKRDIMSVVIYVGQGAGVNDDGIHSLQDPSGEVSLSWRYQVIRLWQVDARELLAQNRPALLALIGQCHIEQPQTLLPEVIRKVKEMTSPTLRGRLVTSLIALLSDKELIDMVEKLVYDSLDEELMELPFPKRLRQQGLEQGHQEELRRNILEALTIRFEPDAVFQERFSRHLANLTTQQELRALFAKVLRADNLGALEPLGG